ncbi:tryptophan-rich sensory protein [Aquimarina sp. U1-2]|uniref:tryptophan-rich sensory protein n=1 Tax=Aquimarina sp. U1-2 TaxID=2823141 RepID=UPI001AECAF3E|nr:tryptophan-rich sensory protein [Aquimarina sp. U1-2]MBP2833175.1 tryptophan-rich sensory protein [Aquimarina sp. U1-2]
MKKKLSIINLISVLFVLGINYLSQTATFNNTTIGEISNTYNNLFTPASYAFAIWGLIFISLIAYSVYQIREAFFKSQDTAFIEQTGYWFLFANFLNGCWVLAFVYDYTGLSVFIMIGILISLIKIILNTNMECWDAPIGTIAFVWWPICLYSGWITVATIANTATYLVKIDWIGFALSEEGWTVAMIIIAMVINILVIMKRNMREFALVGVWALVAIYMRHKDTIAYIAITALVCSAILLIVIGTHGYLNRKTSPYHKLLERFQ